MARLMKIPVVGLVENMAYFRCPDCGKVHHLFGESHAEAQARAYGIPACASLPIDPAVTRAVDQGRVESLELPWLDGLLDGLLN